MNWRTELERMLTYNEDKLEMLVVKSQLNPTAPVVVPIDHPVFDRKFDGGYGCIVSEGCNFTAWGGKYVYFPAVYHGSEQIECVPRNPCLIAITHVGGQ